MSSLPLPQVLDIIGLPSSNCFLTVPVPAARDCDWTLNVTVTWTVTMTRISNRGDAIDWERCWRCWLVMRDAGCRSG